MFYVHYFFPSTPPMDQTLNDLCKITENINNLIYSSGTFLIVGLDFSMENKDSDKILASLPLTHIPQSIGS